MWLTSENDDKEAKRASCSGESLEWKKKTGRAGCCVRFVEGVTLVTKKSMKRENVLKRHETGRMRHLRGEMNLRGAAEKKE